MAAAAHRWAFLLTLVVAFLALQTGWACAYGDDCEDEVSQMCADGDEHGEVPCAPTCTDCVSCSGPARALLADQEWMPMASCLTIELDTGVAKLAPTAEPGRIDRPPRA